MHPFELRGWLFDLDGVLTDTARVHVAAWKATLDEVLDRLALSGDAGRPFDPLRDYERYLDGKVRADGVRDFLFSRGIVLAEGDPADPTDRVTVCGVGNKKNARFLELLEAGGRDVFPSSVLLVRRLVEAGRCTGVVSASENCWRILEVTGLSTCFYVVVDGLVARSQGLAGKPAPDTFLLGASMLGLQPSETAVVEDAPAGVTAGRSGGFGYVVGVARRASAAELLAAGADVVVRDLGSSPSSSRSWRAGGRFPPELPRRIGWGRRGPARVSPQAACGLWAGARPWAAGPRVPAPRLGTVRKCRSVSSKSCTEHRGRLL